MDNKYLFNNVTVIAVRNKVVFPTLNPGRNCLSLISRFRLSERHESICSPPPNNGEIVGQIVGFFFFFSLGKTTLLGEGKTLRKGGVG